MPSGPVRNRKCLPPSADTGVILAALPLLTSPIIFLAFKMAVSMTLVPSLWVASTSVA